MNIQIKNTNLELTQAISDYLYKKLSDLENLVSHHDKDALCRVEIGKTTKHHKSGDVFRAEINLRMKGENVYVVSEREDLYAAIDEVKDESIKKVKSYKGKRETLYLRGKAKVKKMMKGIWNTENF